MKRFLHCELKICLLAYALAMVLTAAYVIKTYSDGIARLLSEAINPFAIEGCAWALSLLVMHIVYWCCSIPTYEVKEIKNS